MRSLGALVAGALLAAAGCSGAAGHEVEADAAARARVADYECPRAPVEPDPVALEGRRLRVVTTVAPITSIVANVAGERAEITGLVPEGVNSHTFEPKPSAAAVLERADVLVANGLGLEEPILALAEERLAPGAAVVELGALALRPDQYLYDVSFPRAAGRPNPHLWTNPPMARCYAVLVADALAAADPAGAASYRRNAGALAGRIDALDEAMVEASATVPTEHRALLTYHDAYAYFAAHYGWRVLGAVQPASFEEPSPRDVARLVDQVEEAGVPAIFGSEVFPSPVLRRIGEETGVRYVDVLRDDDLPGRPGDPKHSLLALLRFDFVTIVDSLGGDAGTLRGVDVSDVVPDRATYPP